MKYLVICLAVLMATLVKQISDNDFIILGIVPGTAINEKDVVKKFGKPVTILELNKDSSFCYKEYFAKYNGYDIYYTCMDSIATIYKISLTSPRIKTIRGLRVGDKHEKFVKKYGLLPKENNDYYYSSWCDQSFRKKYNTCEGAELMIIFRFYNGIVSQIEYTLASD